MLIRGRRESYSHLCKELRIRPGEHRGGADRLPKKLSSFNTKWILNDATGTRHVAAQAPSADITGTNVNCPSVNNQYITDNNVAESAEVRFFMRECKGNMKSLRIYSKFDPEVRYAKRQVTWRGRCCMDERLKDAYYLEFDPEIR